MDREEQAELLIRSYLTAMEGRNPGSRDHARRVAAMAEKLAALIGFDGEALCTVRRAALLHDVGKLGVRDAVIRKPGPLTDAEYAEVKDHPIFGGLWLMGAPSLSACRDGVLYHHERWDGTGYPEGLSGRAIPLIARILAVVDVYDALTSDRVYRKAWPVHQALGLIAEQAGAMFDPAIVHLFLRAAASVGLMPLATAA